MLGLTLAGALLPGTGAGRGPVSPSLEVRAATAKAAEGRRGPRGPRGKRGPDGLSGEPGPRGKDATGRVRRQFVSIGWQNNDWAGNDRQSFVAPGIGAGEVRCTPPNGNEPNGVMWIGLVPDDRGDTQSDPPQRWATTMWTTRLGGNLDDAARSKLSVVRTARLDRAFQEEFHESMNTATSGHDPISTGTFTGLITTEPFDEGTAAPDPTSFRISWHWNLRSDTSAQRRARRCYVSGAFLTEPG